MDSSDKECLERAFKQERNRRRKLRRKAKRAFLKAKPKYCPAFRGSSNPEIDKPYMIPADAKPVNASDPRSLAKYALAKAKMRISIKKHFEVYPIYSLEDAEFQMDWFTDLMIESITGKKPDRKYGLMRPYVKVKATKHPEPPPPQPTKERPFRYYQCVKCEVTHQKAKGPDCNTPPCDQCGSENFIFYDYCGENNEKGNSKSL